MNLLFGACGIIIGLLLGVLIAFFFTKEKFGAWKPISILVVSKETGKEHHADRYKFSKEDNTPYLRIYDAGRFTWLPIGHFKNPYLLMMAVDPEYAKNNILTLFSAGTVEKLTKAAKK